MRLVNIGFGNMIAPERLLAIIAPNSAPVRRMIQDVRDEGKVIDASCGRKTRAVLVLDSGHIVLSAVQPETIASRVDEV